LRWPTRAASRSMERRTVHVLDTRGGRFALAVCSGLLLGLAFPPFCQGWVVFVALVPVLHVIAGSARGRGPLGWRSLLGLGWVFGFVFFLVLLHWIASLTTERMVYPSLRWPAALVASAYLGLYPALSVVVAGIVCRRLGTRGLWVAPFAWTLVEAARGAGTLGFPWGSAGYGLLPYPALMQGASLGGVDLLSFWIVSVNVAVWRLGASLGRPGGRRLRSAAIVALVVVIPWAWGRARIPREPPELLGRVGIVQPSARGDEKWDPANRDASFGVLEQGTRRLSVKDVDLIVWPETAVPLYLRYDAEYFGRTASLARWVARPLLVGFPDAGEAEDGRGLKYNAAGLFDPNGTLARTYWKIHLVPFGEAIPWQDVLPILERIDLGEGDYSPGREVIVFDGPIGRFSVLICFESIFPRLARRFVQRGAEFLVNITNDDWFGDTPAAAQHAAMAVFRAVENGVSVVRCANSGISGLVDPYGRILARTPLFERLEVVVAVPVPLSGTLYRRTGNAFLWICAAGMVVYLVAACALRAKSH